MFAPNEDSEDNEVQRDDERGDGHSSGIYEADQLSECNDDDSTLAEDGAEPQILNKELAGSKKNLLWLLPFLICQKLCSNPSPLRYRQFRVTHI